VARGDRLDTRPVPTSGRIAFARVVGAAVAGPCLAFAGVVVGTLLGLLVARSMLGQSSAIFLIKIAEMLQPVDVVGLIVKGMAFAGSSALIATFEGLRPESRGGPNPYRAVLRSIVAILLLNFTWFNLVYLTGDPFGPDVAVSAG
jgi:ABC-type transporter Mla maintaining outer membrane lipid asymmetry permease subunit MlaE